MRTKTKHRTNNRSHEKAHRKAPRKGAKTGRAQKAQIQTTQAAKKDNRKKGNSKGPKKQSVKAQLKAAAKKHYKEKKPEPVAKEFKYLVKYEDAGSLVQGGRIDRYWDRVAMIKLYPYLRKGPKKLPQSYHYWDHNFLMEYYGLKAWEFGNWVTQEDRMNYVCAAGIAFYDLKAILGFSAERLGLKGMLAMAIGARGKGRATAHFEPYIFMINLTRYQEDLPFVMSLPMEMPRNPKLIKFLKTGGAGALAHEYGHALDYFFGGYVEQDKDHFSLTQGRSTRTQINPNLIDKQSMRGETERLLATMIWKKGAQERDPRNGQRTDYYSKLFSMVVDKNLGDYWLRRNELFARAFEQYISFKMKQKGIKNTFLHQEKYEWWAYMDEALLKKVAKHFDRLIGMMRKAKV